jgi:DNA-binding protein HU-beta
MMNKNELITEVAERAGLTKSAAGQAVGSVFEVISGALAKGDEVRLVGFGTFLTANRKATEGRNPRTGAALKIAATRLPKFRAGKNLKDQVAL